MVVNDVAGFVVGQVAHVDRRTRCRQLEEVVVGAGVDVVWVRRQQEVVHVCEAGGVFE